MTRGSCDRSFGIHVARIANFPAHVVSEAERFAIALENGEHLSAHLFGSNDRQSSTDACQPENTQRPRVSCGETALPTGAKRTIADIADTEHGVVEGAARKRVV